ncbi:MAG: hypothetical protein M1840_006391 [Geoglossum simile]|nr:MAG: hypothetical protein M1840_006391 [Geoglossum simile]
MLGNGRHLTYARHLCDKNIYNFVTIGQYNIVIASSALGNDTGIAATVAEHMLFTFPSIRIVLMVGIGNGIPGNGCDPQDGDIVVGTKVVQYDLGSSSSSKLPPVFLNAISDLRKDPELGQNISRSLSIAGHIRMESPCVHYGIIASGSRVITDARRDQPGKTHGAICFETEAVGLMYNFPCLIIRGICDDYSETCRYKHWESRAATAAAAYAAELLKIIPPDQVYKTPFAAEAILATLKQITASKGDAREQVIAALEGKFNFYLMCHRSLPNTNSGGYRQRVRSWLSVMDYATRRCAALSKRYEGTGLWFLKSPEFARWQGEGQKTLFCPGVPGAGKTIMSSIVVEHLSEKFSNKKFREHGTAVAFLSCGDGVRCEQKAVDLLSALLEQLVLTLPLVPEPVKHLYDAYHCCETRPSFSEISKALLATVGHFSRVFIIIDALDEYEDDGDTRKELLSAIRDIQNLRLMVTSRETANIAEEFRGDIRLDVRSDEDIRNYLKLHLAEGEFISTAVARDPDIPETIINTIVAKADGSFRLAREFLRSLHDQPTLGDIRAALRSLEDGTDNK